MKIDPEDLYAGQVLLVNGALVKVELTQETVGGFDAWLIFLDSGEERNLQDEDDLESVF